MTKQEIDKMIEYQEYLYLPILKTATPDSTRSGNNRDRRKI